jgi:hypothetical protein
MKTTIVIQGPELDDRESFAGDAIHARIRAEAARIAREQNAEVERRILAGEDRIEIPFFPFGGDASSEMRRLVYVVPSWRHEPIKRLRVEWARWKARRG